MRWRGKSLRGRRNRRVDRPRRAERKRRLLGMAKLVVVLFGLGLAGWHAVRFADAHDWLDVFRVREVRVVGVDVTHPTVLVAEAGLMGAEIHWWSPLGAYVERVERDPMVASARFERRFPNGLILQVVEREPVALLSIDRLTPVDSTGVVLPVTPYRSEWSVPVLSVTWPPEQVTSSGRVRPGAVREALSWLGEVTRRFPELAAEVSAIELDRSGTMVLHLVHARGEVVLDGETPIEKLALVDDVLLDLRRKGIGYRLLDLRFENQIVVRRG